MFLHQEVVEDLAKFRFSWNAQLALYGIPSTSPTTKGEAINIQVYSVEGLHDIGLYPKTAYAAQLEQLNRDPDPKQQKEHIVHTVHTNMIALVYSIVA